ncbi:metalloregulator ArsR/SmtB family transcription factor [Cellulomonas fimi]|uniref:ArsR/SmtB family transcription factor n=1 Tax=Cellulomonas fimi TaxID=1708 RepID=UPI0028934626|nr:metalloregulator ArsR/SmtB family transcription factor [Cellulomonas fimi]
MPLRALGIDTPLHELKADLFKALAHPVRVRALELLLDGERPVSSLLAETQMEASHLSQHLAVLRRAGMVTARREGNAVHYRLAHPAVPELLTAARTVLVSALSTTRAALAGLEDDARPTTTPAS